ncbi:hypothetical protein ACQ4PT_023362 [Festuca glaucescens]
MDSRMDRIRKFMLQEEEDDDELFLVLLPAIYSSLYEEKCPVHTSSLSGAQLVKEILEGHQSWSKNCIGAIDRTHIPITIGEEKAAPYRNRKGTLSQNMMVACDFDLNFTFISCGWEGSASDAGVLRSAISKGFEVPAGKFYLVDGGYGNTSSFLAPYPGVWYHLGEFRRRRRNHTSYANKEELFNHRHALLQNYIERAIGVLKKRFPLLKVGNHYPIESQIRIHAACVVFHNIIRAMVKETSRASWSHSYERGLAEILVEHNVPVYRGQNGWVAEGWKSIASKFNSKFPSAQFTKQQIQEKEKDMKANYKAVRDARKQSGTGWDASLSMIIAEPIIWEKLKKDYPMVKRYEGKPFLLFPTLASLYEGSIATGDLNFLSIPIPSVDLTGEEASPTNSSTNQLGTVNPLSSTHDAGQSSNMHGQEAQPTTSISSGQKEDEPVRKRKQSQIVVVLNDYVDFKKQQNQKFMEEMKEPKQTDQFTIATCVAALETMEDLSIAEKSKALRLFKCQHNREIFLNTKDPLLRTFWLKEEISDMEKA